MSLSKQSNAILHTEGLVEQIDAINRELLVLSAGTSRILDVPPGCPVMLHGERVKFRMIQPRDRVKIRYIRCCGRLVAQAIDVQAGNSTALP